MVSLSARSIKYAAILVARHGDHDHSHDEAELDAEALAEMCGAGTDGDVDSLMGLRIGAIFIIFITALIGTLFPILARRSGLAKFIPEVVFDFAKYFGSGVIIATAFIHLLYHAIVTIDTPCLGEGWQEYPWALALCMIAVFLLFFVELLAFRWGNAKLAKAGVTQGYDPHGHAVPIAPRTSSISDIEKAPQATADGSRANGPFSVFTSTPFTQATGIFVLEFGILLHSVLIGLMLAVTDSADFRVLLVVLVFHQTFEGLGLGSRLSLLSLPTATRFLNIPILAAIIYALSTPIGIAAGLGVRSTYNPHSSTASAVSGVMDAISAGVLLYTGLVELLAHEFLFNPQILAAPSWRLIYICVCMSLGAAMMALLGKWA